MKQLILTFFAVILCYSLFFDKEPEKTAVDGINYIYDNALSPVQPYIALDTLHKYSFYQLPFDVNIQFCGYATSQNEIPLLIK